MSWHAGAGRGAGVEEEDVEDYVWVSPGDAKTRMRYLTIADDDDARVGILRPFTHPVRGVHGTVASTACCIDVSLPRAMCGGATADTFKVVYLWSSRLKTTLDGVVCLLQLRSDVGRTRVFANDAEGALDWGALPCGPGQQLVVDQALVVAAHILGTAPGAVQDAAVAYRTGTHKLVPQMALFTGSPFHYEVGEAVQEAQAGVPGLHGCRQGIHVFARKVDALEYARQMAVSSVEAPDVKMAVQDVTGEVPTEDMPTAWWPWNTHDNNTTCVLCSLQMTCMPRSSRIMSCGHRVCRPCATRIAEQGGAHMVPLQCSLCSVPVVRLEAYAW